ncbi:MAG: mechanosensitive ion channel family protein [Pelagibaca sp.]
MHIRSVASLRRSVFAAAAIALFWVSAAFAQDISGTWYEVEAINRGLDDAPTEEIDRTAPRQTLRGFMDATDAGDYTRAAHYLNLAEIDPEEQATAGPDIARHLSSVIARQVWIDWSDLSSRPDAMIEGPSDTNPRAGQPRRNLLISSLETATSTYDIRLARYKAPDRPAIWLFTPQTVDNIEALYVAFGPRPYEDQIPEPLRRELAGLWLWEWIAIPVLIVGLAGLGYATHQAALWLSRRSRHTWLQKGLERSSMPLAILVMAGATQLLVTYVLSFSGPVQAVLRPALIILMVWGFGMTALRILDAVLHKITIRFVGEIDDKRGRDEREFYTSIYALRRLIVLLMVALALIIVLAQLNLFDTVGLTLLASAGVLTVVFGIAGQAILGNILASLQIAFAKPVRIGDSVLFEGDWAYVEAVFYTFLRLRTWDHRRIVVPVTYFVSKPFENWSVAEARMMKVIDLNLDHRADVDVLRDHFDMLVQDDPDITESDSALTRTTGHSADGLTVTFYAMMDDPSTGWTVQCRLREQMMAFVRDTHPDWFPRERVQEVGQDGDNQSGATRMAGTG